MTADPTDFIDLSTGQPRPPRRQLPMRQLVRGASLLALAAVVAVACYTRRWVDMLTIGGLILNLFGGVALARGPFIAAADADRAGVQPSWIGRQLGTPWLTVGGDAGAHEQAEAIVILTFGFVLQLVAAIMTAVK